MGFASVAALASGALVAVSLLLLSIEALAYGFWLGPIVFLIGLMAALPLGALVGLGNGLLARTDAGSGWPAVLAVAVVVGGLAALVLPAVLGGGGLVEGAGDAWIGVSYALAAGGHLRLQRRRRVSPVAAHWAAQPPPGRTTW